MSAQHPPDTGHTFRIKVDVRGSAKVVGDKHHADQPGWHSQEVEVRAWNLRDALARSAELPLSAWFPEEGEHV